MVIRNLLCCVIVAQLLGMIKASCNQNDSLLREQFCQVYYRGTGDCTKLRDSICADHTTFSVPVLTLGDPTAPPIVFFHGWPDTSALWANQFEAFCAPPHGKYFCVAPSMFGYHPDVSPPPPPDLTYVGQIDAYHEMVAQMGLKDITLVIFDVGAVVGYQYTYKYPNELKCVIAMDVGMGLVSPPTNRTFGDLQPYQQNNVDSFLTHNDTIMRAYVAAHRVAVPCGCPDSPPGRDCGCLDSIDSYWGWPYYQLINNSGLQALAPDTPVAQWMFSDAPSFPDVPLLFLWGTCNMGSGSGWGRPCVRRTAPMFGPDWAHWVSTRGLHSMVVGIHGAGHWTQCRVPNATSSAMSAWLAVVDGK